MTWSGNYARRVFVVNCLMEYEFQCLEDANAEYSIRYATKIRSQDTVEYGAYLRRPSEHQGQPATSMLTSISL